MNWTGFNPNIVLSGSIISIVFTLSGLFEGDIVIDEDTERYLTGGEIISRDAVVSPVLYWPNGIVYYKFDEELGVLTLKFSV